MLFIIEDLIFCICVYIFKIVLAFKIVLIFLLTKFSFICDYKMYDIEFSHVNFFVRIVKYLNKINFI